MLTFSSIVAGIWEFLVWNFRELESLVMSTAEAGGAFFVGILGIMFHVGIWVLAGQAFWSIGKWIFGVV